MNVARYFSGAGVVRLQLNRKAEFVQGLVKLGLAVVIKAAESDVRFGEIRSLRDGAIRHGFHAGKVGIVQPSNEPVAKDDTVREARCGEGKIRIALQGLTIQRGGAIKWRCSKR